FRNPSKVPDPRSGIWKPIQPLTHPAVERVHTKPNGTGGSRGSATAPTARNRKVSVARSLAHAQNIASAIPPGQPILVGHHSERRHRRDLNRINGLTRKGFDALEESKRLERRAL